MPKKLISGEQQQNIFRRAAQNLIAGSPAAVTPGSVELRIQSK